MWSYGPCSPDLDSLMAPVLLLSEILSQAREETRERGVFSGGLALGRERAWPRMSKSIYGALGCWECRAPEWLNPGKWKDLTLTGLEIISVTEQALFPLCPQRMEACIRKWKLVSSCNDLLIIPHKNSLWNVGGNVLTTAWQCLWSDFVMPRKLHLFTYPLAIASHFALLNS